MGPETYHIFHTTQEGSVGFCVQHQGKDQPLAAQLPQEVSQPPSGDTLGLSGSPLHDDNQWISNINPWLLVESEPLTQIPAVAVEPQGATFCLGERLGVAYYKDLYVQSEQALGAEGVLTGQTQDENHFFDPWLQLPLNKWPVDQNCSRLLNLREGDEVPGPKNKAEMHMNSIIDGLTHLDRILRDQTSQQMKLVKDSFLA